MRSQFDEQLQQLHRELVAMGALCEESIALCAKAVQTGDPVLAGGISPLEQKIDRKERSIESGCLDLLLRQQPVASDLRRISAALKMITDMERIGDQAADIAEIVQNHPVEDGGAAIGDMARAVIGMVTDSVDAYVREDVAQARAVMVADDQVDALFLTIRGQLAEIIRNDPEAGEQAIDCLMIAKYLERIGDHAVNIAEWAEFAATGVHKGFMEL